GCAALPLHCLDWVLNAASQATKDGHDSWSKSATRLLLDDWFEPATCNDLSLFCCRLGKLCERAKLRDPGGGFDFLFDWSGGVLPALCAVANHSVQLSRARHRG